MQIAIPAIGLIAWFIRLEYKVVSHDRRFKETGDRNEKLATDYMENNQIMQQMALDIKEIKTNLSWILPKFKDKI